MKDEEHPALQPGRESDIEAEGEVQDRIRKLAAGQPYGVLCTQGESQPYGSIIAHAFSDDLRTIVFATPTATRKYRLLTGCRNVALVVDNRRDFPNEMMRIEAMTITGRAEQVPAGAEFEKWAGLLIAKHPHLESFIRSSSSALFRIGVTRYLHVSRFQEVRQWIPAPP